MKLISRGLEDDTSGAERCFPFFDFSPDYCQFSGFAVIFGFSLIPCRMALVGCADVHWKLHVGNADERLLGMIGNLGALLGDAAKVSVAGDRLVL